MNIIARSPAMLYTYSCRSWQIHIRQEFRGRRRELGRMSLESHGLLVTGTRGMQTLQAHSDIQQSHNTAI